MNILIGVLILAVPNCCPMLFRPQIKHAGPKPWMAIPLTLSKFQLKTRKKKQETQKIICHPTSSHDSPPTFLGFRGPREAMAKTSARALAPPKPKELTPE